ncbi:TPM domain-containing protein [Actinoplanes aureus]|uniref:TPM domain-containing protein n=1 Tax=Actinoplanes aureus TaxID=2792083 RepID=A0A931G0A1_9ACTN|nr:TPM domain-containing protein [Actinoplanes aureus]MBG0565557.1 TPM domain-containing protein [Actinoplanes aureus]
MPRRPVVVPLLALLLALVALPGPARADAPGRLAVQVTDEAGVLGDRAGVDAALRDLRQETGIQLFVVFVGSFDGTPAQRWTDETARLSDLGDRDALLAVATTDRAYAYSFPDDSRISDDELAGVAADEIEPALARGDWSGAVIAAARGYQDAAGGGSGGVGLGAPLLVLGAVLAGALIWLWLRRRRKTAPAAPAGPSTQDLTNQANALLIELDDDLRASEREGELATAQYGAAATQRFQAALTSARGDVAEAFRLRMTLEEEPAPDEDTRRRTLTRIIELCRGADTRLDAESEAFDQLRDLEGRAAEVADDLDRQRAAAEAALPAAAARVEELTAHYSGSTVTAVTGNVDQARERLAFAAAALEQARSALAGTPADGPQAALAVRAAEQAIDQAVQLSTAVDKAAADLPAARTAADALVAEVEAEVAAGRAALAGDTAAPDGLPAAVSGGEQAVAEARAALGAPRPDPVAVVARLQAADAALDSALAAARDRAERDAHARTLLAQTLPVARAEVSATDDFVATRRGAVGSEARVRLSEAHRHLALAEQLAVPDPGAALREAQQARHLAAAAGQAAQADVHSWNPAGPYGHRGGIDAGSFAGAVLGGILAGGVRSGGGWGGGFGGSGSRARRTGGGGGGGRRGGGGRF